MYFIFNSLSYIDKATSEGQAKLSFFTNYIILDFVPFVKEYFMEKGFFAVFVDF